MKSCFWFLSFAEITGRNKERALHILKMQRLFLDREIDKDFDEIKNKKFGLVLRIFYRVLKNNPFLSFIGFLLPLVVAIVNNNYNHINKEQLRNMGENIVVSSKFFRYYFNYLFKIYESSNQLNFIEFFFRVISPYLITKAVLSISHIYLNSYISWKVDNDLKKDLFGQFVDSKYENSSKISPKIFTQFSSNIEGISEQVWAIPNRFFYVIISLLLNFFYELKDRSASTIYPLFLTFMLTFSVMYFFLKKSTREFTNLKKRNEDNTKFIFERIRNLSHIKLSSSEDIEKAKLAEKLDKTFVQNKQSLNLTVFLQAIPQYFVIPLIPWLISIITIFLDWKAKQQTKLSLLISQFLTYRTLCSEFEKMINSFVRIDNLVSEVEIITESILELNKNKKNGNSNLSKASFNGDIILENISFSYPLRPNLKVIENLSFRFQRGRKYGIAGKNGVGKSTIIKIILKLFDFSEGRIFLSNQDIKCLEKRSLHDQICRLTNSPSFFNMSIAENIFYPYSFSHNEENIEILWEAARKVKIENFISSLPFSFDTVIRESGADLSEGQKQQIEAMKVFVRPYEIYMFDEILSNVHPQTREIILENIFKETEEKTALVIDHHYDIFKYMDEVYNFSKSELKKISLDDLDQLSDTGKDDFDHE